RERRARLRFPSRVAAPAPAEAGALQPLPPIRRRAAAGVTLSVWRSNASLSSPRPPFRKPLVDNAGDLVVVLPGVLYLVERRKVAAEDSIIIVHVVVGLIVGSGERPRLLVQQPIEKLFIELLEQQVTTGDGTLEHKFARISTHLNQLVAAKVLVNNPRQIHPDVGSGILGRQILWVVSAVVPVSSVDVRHSRLEISRPGSGNDGQL